MKTEQIQKMEQMDEVIFDQASQIVQVGFSTDKAILLQIAKSVDLLEIDEATFVINNEGLSFRGMDAQHVALIDMGIPNTCFEKWSCIEEQKFALNISEFRKLVSSLDAKGTISLVIKDKEILVTQNGFTANIRALEPSATDCPLPRIPYDCEMVLSNVGNYPTNTMDLKKLLTKISMVSDYVTMGSNDSNIVFSGKGDNGNAEISLSKEQVSISNKEDSESTYSLEYIIPFMKTLNKESYVLVGFSTTKPLRIQTHLINGVGRIDFYLAPRVEN